MLEEGKEAELCTGNRVLSPFSRWQLEGPRKQQRNLRDLLLK